MGRETARKARGRYPGAVKFRSPARAGAGSVLSIRPFRRLWIATSLSSLGDWLSLLALTALASTLTREGVAANAAVSGVWLTSLLPALIFGPLAGAVADRLDRRLNMIIGDVVRAVLYVSIPVNVTFGVVNKLTWLYVAQFLASCASLFWTPAKDASVPNLVPPDKLEEANQYSLFTTYGSAPVAGGLFGLLALASSAIAGISPYFHSANQVNLALYFNAATFVVSAVTIYLLREIPKRQASAHISAPSVAKTIWEGWKFLGKTAVVRGIVIGMVGAFSAGGVVVGLGPPYIKQTLHGGNAGWGLVFGAIFVGLAGGMFLGTRLLKEFSLHRQFGLSIAVAAVPLALIALIPNLIVVTLMVVLIGVFAGIAYVTGYTVVGRDVDDDTRGRTFAFLQSGVRVILFAVIAVAPVLAGGFTALWQGVTGSSTLQIGSAAYHAIGDNIVLLLAAAVALWLGIVSYRHMDDRKGVPLWEDLVGALRGQPFVPVRAHLNGQGPDARRGLLIALEGGEGSGKTTQARLLGIWLREQGYDVVSTHEPGATKVGMRLRALLLDSSLASLSPRAEALMYAADRAEHVDQVIGPALERGAIVVTDRYMDSSIAYQGSGRSQPVTDVARLNRWATGSLVADLTVVLDLPPDEGLKRRAPSGDRLEAEPPEFHERVRAGFLAQAHAEPQRYLVLDATLPPEEITRQIRDRLRDLLPDPVPPAAEDNTGSFPAIID
ncbi:MAG: dTMP kinase [Actinobacteria bacterium]|nr:dTMP kinase [Actinomycetota bacterium]